MLLMLAQSAAAEEGSKLMFYAAITIAAILLVGWIAIAVARRRSAQASQQFASMLPFTLHDLRQMHEAGQLTDEEFERARQRILKLSKQQLEPQAAGEDQDDQPDRPRGPGSGTIPPDSPPATGSEPGNG